MLHQISWSTYAVCIICLLIAYYFYVGIAFYRPEIASGIYHLAGRRSDLKTTGSGDFQIPSHDVMGKARTDEIGLLSQEELSFAPSEPDEYDVESSHVTAISPEAPGRLISSFSEMIAEIKTLIRVINESSESKENFEMLFCLIIQKYPELRETGYQQQVNDFLLSEGAPEFPFDLTAAELESYWLNEV